MFPWLFFHLMRRIKGGMRNILYIPETYPTFQVHPSIMKTGKEHPYATRCRNAMPIHQTYCQLNTLLFIRILSINTTFINILLNSY